MVTHTLVVLGGALITNDVMQGAGGLGSGGDGPLCGLTGTGTCVDGGYCGDVALSKLLDQLALMFY